MEKKEYKVWNDTLGSWNLTAPNGKIYAIPSHAAIYIHALESQLQAKEEEIEKLKEENQLLRNVNEEKLTPLAVKNLKMWDEFHALPAEERNKITYVEWCHLKNL